MLVSVVGASDHAEGAPLVFYYVLFTFGKRSITLVIGGYPFDLSTNSAVKFG